MLLTEKEAKTKWCPMVRAADCERAVGYNRWDDVQAPMPVGSLCIGSACMAWRWNDNGSLNAIKVRKASGKGRCGLAGSAT